MKNLYINGCSYTVGHELDSEQTWPVLLSKLTNLNLINESKNGQSMESIKINSINHLSRLDPKDTTVVIGLTWPLRTSYSYNRFNINFTPSDLEGVLNLKAKLSTWRRISSPYYFTHKELRSERVNNNALELNEKQEEGLEVLSKYYEYQKALVSHSSTYTLDNTTRFITDIISLQSFLKVNEFKYSFVYFDVNIFAEILYGELSYLSEQIDFEKTIELPECRPNTTCHPTALDCKEYAKEIYETVF